jgi:hypothetical protein
MVRCKFTSPKKGTKAREIINLMLRPCGLSSSEAAKKKLIKNTNGLTAIISRFEYESGFDIRVIGKKSSSHKRGAKEKIYRIVGRHRWNGKYFSLVRMPEDEYV